MVISGKNMEKSGKFQVNENKLVVLGETPQFPWKSPQIILWKDHNLTGVKPVKKPVKPVKEPVEPALVNSVTSRPVKSVNTMKNRSSLYPVKNGLLNNTLRMQEALRQSPG
jgi:hypothetical protein